MARARELDPYLLTTLYQRWQAASARNEKSAVVAEACALWGITKPVIYKAFSRLGAGLSVFDVAGRKTPRKKSAARKALDEQRLAYAMKVGQYKYGGLGGGSKGYTIPTERIIELAIAQGDIQPEEALSRSQTDRLLRKAGVSARDFTVDKKTAVTILGGWTNEAWFIDATPLNRQFLRLDGNVIRRTDLNPSDKHLDDILQKDGLKKIWVFFAVDLYSDAYFLHAFAPEPTTPGAKRGGENSVTWMQFLDMAFLPKNNFPFEGLPEGLYSDRFSGIAAKTGALTNYLRTLEITSKTHFPGNSRAKGRVERMQGIFKQRFETVLNLFNTSRREINLESLNRYALASTREHNEKTGRFAKYLEGLKAHPTRKVTLKNLQDARVHHVTRSLTSYKTVTIKWDRLSESQTYFIEGAADFERGKKFHIYKNVNGVVKAQDPNDGRVYNCDPRGALAVRYGSHELLDGRHGLAETDAEKRRKEIVKNDRTFRRALNFDAIFPPENNLVYMPTQGEVIQTNSIVAPDTFATADEARAWLAFTSRTALGTLRDDLAQRIDKVLDLDIELNGSITRETAQRLLDILIVEKEQNQKVQEN